MREMPSHTRPSNPEAGSESSDPPRRPLTITRRNGTNGFNGCLRLPGRPSAWLRGRHVAVNASYSLLVLPVSGVPAAELTGRIPSHSCPRMGTVRVSLRIAIARAVRVSVRHTSPAGASSGVQLYRTLDATPACSCSHDDEDTPIVEDTSAG